MFRQKTWIDAVFPVFFGTARAPGNCSVFSFVFPIIPACKAGSTVLVVVAVFSDKCLEDLGKHTVRQVVVIGSGQK